MLRYFKGKPSKKIVGAGAAVLAGAALFYYFKKKDSKDKKTSEKNNIKYLSEVQAKQRSQQITANVSYKLVLKLLKGTRYEGLVKIEFETKNTEDLFLDFQGTTINEIYINGTQTAEKNIRQGAFVQLAKKKLVAGKNIIDIRFENDYATDGNDTDKKQYVYSTCEPYWANKIFPCFDQPDIKGTFELLTITPNDWVAISNELITSSKAFNSDLFKGDINDISGNLIEFMKELNENYNVTSFKKTKPLSSYLYTCIAGPYLEYKCTNLYNDIPMSVYCRESLFEHIKKDAEGIFELTIKATQYLEKLFDYKYPFSKYDNVFCPEYNAGAMENPGVVTFNDNYVFRDQPTLEEFTNRARVIVHELTHMWFGDLVTMKWWNDLWLNESFADFISFHVLSQKDFLETLSFPIGNSRISFNLRKSWGYKCDLRPTTHPIAGTVANTEEADSIFDGITYAKGAAVLKQLLYMIGVENFTKSLSEYFKKYEWKNAELENLLDEIEKNYNENELGISLKNWKQEWICTAGVNEVTVEIDRENQAEDKTKIVVKQSSALAEFPTLRHHNLTISFFNADCKFETFDLKIKNVENTELEFPTTYREAFLLNSGDEAYIKVILDDKSKQFFKTNLYKLEDPLHRTVLWRAFYDMANDAVFSSKDYIEIAVESLPTETETNLIKQCLDFGLVVVHTYTPLKSKKKLYTRMFGVLKEILAKGVDNKKKEAILTNYLVSYARDDNDIKELFNCVFVEKGGNLCPDIPLEDKKKVLENMRLEDNSDKALRHERTCLTIAGTEQERENIYKQILDSQNKDSVKTLEAIMVGLNYDEAFEQMGKHSDLFFAKVIQVFEERSLEFAKDFFFYMFPRSDDFKYLNEQIDEVYEKTSENMLILRKLLKEKKDELQKKINAYSKFLEN